MVWWRFLLSYFCICIAAQLDYIVYHAARTIALAKAILPIASTVTVEVTKIQHIARRSMGSRSR